MKSHLPPLPRNIGAVGEPIAQLRKERGYTQKELAERIGIERPLLTDYEIGRLRLGDEMLARFAIALGVSAEHLLGLSESDALDYNPDLKITKRLRRIHELPQAQKQALLKTIDAYLVAARTKQQPEHASEQGGSPHAADDS